MVQKIVNGHKYDIQCVPLELSPHTTLYTELNKKPVTSVQEAEEIRKQLKEIVNIVLKETVKPDPEEGDKPELFSFVTAYTAKQITEQTKFFREPPESTSPSGGGVGNHSS